MHRVVALALAPLAVLPMLAVPVAGLASATAAPADPPTRLDQLFIDITSRTVIDVGASGSSVGDLTITAGTVSATPGGDRIGYFTTRVVVVVPGAMSERRDTYVQLRLPGGTLMLRQLQVDPTGAPPNAVHRMAIVGGNGPYFAARGQATTTPVGKGRLRLDMTYLPVEAMNAFQTIEYRRVVTDFVTGSVGSADGIGVTAKTVRGFLAVDGVRYPFTCGQTAGDAVGIGAPSIASWICRYSMPGGSLLTMSVTQQASGTPPLTSVTQAVIGGTGDFAGARGSATMAQPDWSSNGRLAVTLAQGSGEYRVARPTWQRDRTDRWAVPLGSERLGEIVVGEGVLMGEGTAPSIGYTVRTSASTDSRLTQFAFTIAEGTLYGTAAISAPAGQAPNTPYLVWINGGTDACMGATGMIRVVPTGATTADIIGNLRVAPLPFE